MAEIHNSRKRMPFLLNPNDYSSFLKGDDDIFSYSPLHENEMSFHGINKRILLSTYNNIPEVQKEFKDNIGTQGVLF